MEAVEKLRLLRLRDMVAYGGGCQAICINSCLIYERCREARDKFDPQCGITFNQVRQEIARDYLIEREKIEIWKKLKESN